jgi:predicted phosphodiesterase
MRLGVIGDVHGAFDALAAVMAGAPEVEAWLSVGDVASEAGHYPAPARPFYFIKGNNEDFDLLARMCASTRDAGRDLTGEELPPNLRYLPNGVPVEVGGVRIVGLGGTFAPKWYDVEAGALPPWRPAARRRPGGEGDRVKPPVARDDKRRHFVRAEVEACASLHDIDLFLTHEAPGPYWVGTGRARNDAGKTAINEVLGRMRPRLHFFGHHHRFSEATREGVPSIGLPLVTDGYVVIDAGTWEWTRRELPPADDAMRD